MTKRNTKNRHQAKADRRRRELERQQQAHEKYMNDVFMPFLAEKTADKDGGMFVLYSIIPEEERIEPHRSIRRQLFQIPRGVRKSVAYNEAMKLTCPTMDCPFVVADIEGMSRSRAESISVSHKALAGASFMLHELGYDQDGKAIVLFTPFSTLLNEAA